MELDQLGERSRTTYGAAKSPGVLDKLFDEIAQTDRASEVAFGKWALSERLMVIASNEARTVTLGGAIGIVREAKIRVGLRKGSARFAVLCFGLAMLWHAPPYVLKKSPQRTPFGYAQGKLRAQRKSVQKIIATEGIESTEKIPKSHRKGAKKKKQNKPYI